MELTFEQALLEEFLQERPDTLDDDIQDKFDAWVERLDTADLIILADKYGTFRSQI